MAILVVRLIVENNIDLRKILMVTFTKAAVAELEGRIRKFIRQAEGYVVANESCDSTIMSIVNKSIEMHGAEKIKLRLQNATQYLDETSIYTIHSFCQKTLTEFAFETDQLFGCEVVADDSSLVAEAVNHYWRTNITTIETDRLTALVENGLFKDDLTNVVNKILSGKQYIYNESLDHEEVFENYFHKQELVDKLISEFVTLFENSQECSVDNISSNKFAKNGFLPLINLPHEFLNLLLTKKDAKYVVKLFPELLEAGIKIDNEKSKRDVLINELIISIYGISVNQIVDHITQIKNDRSIFTYNDLIVNLHSALSKPNADVLKRALQKKYNALFIDEFQDTDRMQYELFYSVFHNSSIMFYIGDPKQSIYSFRGADIDIYKIAAQQVDAAFTMKKNFRSTEKLISAYNHIFTSVADPFNDDEIGYEVVSNGLDLPELLLNSEPVKPLSIFSVKKKSEVFELVSYDVQNLLVSNYTINKRKVIPSDIAILVRSKKEAADIKSSLNKLKIPAVTIDDTKVLQSEEATILLFVLIAVTQPNRSNIYRALLNRLTMFTKDDVLQIDEEHEIVVFRKIMKVWESKGIYAALSLFIKQFNIRSSVQKDIERGERSISNVLQIIELLHKIEIENSYSPDELLGWLHRVMDGEELTGDEFTQRIESDEDAVRIVTIHKSKGLSYNIVFAPFLNLSSDFRGRSAIEYKDLEGNYCFSHYCTENEQQLYSDQTEKENRRLIYVALTRAVSKCFIYNNRKNGIANFALNIGQTPEIEIDSNLASNDSNYLPLIEESEKSALSFNGNINSEWKVSSFTALSNRHISFSPLQKSSINEYDEFVFSTLPKGSLAGIFLHEIFENCDFTKDSFNDVIDRVAAKYPSLNIESYADNLNSMISNVIHANCHFDDHFQLKDIVNSKKIVELEFFFDINKLSTAKLDNLLELVKVRDHKTLRGVMTGFIDLFFEYNGKYYILDWKSNFLGNSLENYSNENMKIAIEGNNYQLQYMIYTIAIKRYLSSRIDNFDYDRDFGGVIYVFLRGCRQNTDSGIYFTKPSVEDIDKLENIL